MKSEMNENFDEAFRRWAERPPATSATDAARAVVARLQAEGERRETAGGRGDVRRAAADGGLPPLAAVLRVPLRLASARRARSGQPDSGHVGSDPLRRRLRLSPAWATLAAATLLLVAGTASFIRSLPARSDAPGDRAGDRRPRASARGPLGPLASVPARDADVVLWLDDGTPVYVFLPGGD